jgi:hypothetical protein
MAGDFDIHPASVGEPQQRRKARLPDAFAQGRPPEMVDQHGHGNAPDPWHIHQKLIVPDLQVQHHVKIGKLRDQAVRVAVIIIAVKRGTWD